VRRTNGYVTLLSVEVDKLDEERGGAHRTRYGQAVLRRAERERDRLIKVCQVAISLGIAERHVRIAEREGELLASAVVAAVEKAGLTDEQRRVVLGEVAARLRSAAPHAAPSAPRLLDVTAS
jgi:hypothetical protein